MKKRRKDEHDNDNEHDRGKAPYGEWCWGLDKGPGVFPFTGRVIYSDAGSVLFRMFYQKFFVAVGILGFAICLRAQQPVIPVSPPPPQTTPFIADPTQAEKPGAKARPTAKQDLSFPPLRWHRRRSSKGQSRGRSNLGLLAPSQFPSGK